MSARAKKRKTKKRYEFWQERLDPWRCPTCGAQITTKACLQCTLEERKAQERINRAN